MLSFSKIVIPRPGGRPQRDGNQRADCRQDFSAIMTVDRDFMVTYVNGPTRELLKKNEAAFRSMWPSFDADKIIGMCIDTFHKNPSHQRQMLADPCRLPINTEITIGDLKVALLVNGRVRRKTQSCRQRSGMARRYHGAHELRHAGCDQQGAGGDRVQRGWQDSARQRKLPEDARLHAGRDQGPASFDVRRSGLPAKPRLPDVLGQARPRRIRRRPVQADRQGRQGGLDPGQLQPDPRRQRQALQGREIRNRHHRAESYRTRTTRARSRRSARPRPSSSSRWTARS